MDKEHRDIQKTMTSCSCHSIKKCRMRFSSFLLSPNWKLSCKGLKLLSEVTHWKVYKLKARSESNLPRTFHSPVLISEARDRCFQAFFPSSLFLAKLQPMIKTNTPTHPAASHHYYTSEPSSRERELVVGPKKQLEQRAKENNSWSAWGRERQPSHVQESQEAKPSPDISKTNLCPGFHHLGRAPPPGGR